MSRVTRVLVVDDNPVNLSVLEEMLSEEYSILFAQNGAEAIRTARRYQPKFVLLDVMMPGMDGLEVCRQLRALSRNVPPTIIMVSAKAMPSEQIAGLEAGADEYLTKPFDEVELLEVLRRYNARPADEFTLGGVSQEEAGRTPCADGALVSEASE